MLSRGGINSFIRLRGSLRVLTRVGPSGSAHFFCPVLGGRVGLVSGRGVGFPTKVIVQDTA